MAYSYVRYTGNGTTASYTFPFQYINSDHVQVRVNGVAAIFSFLNANTVTITPAPTAGSVVEIKRVTNKDTVPVNFTDGSVLLERDLDLLAKFDLYIAQEADDAVEQSIKQDSSGVFQALNRRIANLADPIADQDAATKKWVVDNTNLTNDAATSAVASAASATASANSATASAASATASAASATLATQKSQIVVDNIDAIQAIGDNEEVIIGVASDLQGTGFTYDMGSITDPAVGPSATPPGYLRSVYTYLGDLHTVGNDLAGSGFDYDLGTITSPATPVAPGSPGVLRTVVENLDAIQSAVSNLPTMAAAEVAATNAAASATAAAGSSSSASTSATSAANSASTATTQATNAAASATSASSSASSASTSATNAATSATNAANSATAAALSLFNFKGQYLGPLSENPTVDGNGNALSAGDLYFNTTSSLMKVYSGSVWQNAGSAVNGTSARFRYVATAGQTTFTGNDSNANSLLYDVGFIDVYLNGIRLDSTDFTATSGTSIVLTTAAALNDELNIVAYGTFSVASVNGNNITDNTVGINKLTSTLDLGALP